MASCQKPTAYCPILLLLTSVLGRTRTSRVVVYNSPDSLAHKKGKGSLLMSTRPTVRVGVQAHDGYSGWVHPCYVLTRKPVLPQTVGQQISVTY